jgi:hypothetical protein
MKPRHAAALALLMAWYLMVPPEGCTGKIRMNAPLSNWSSVDSFDSLDDCKSRGSGLQNGQVVEAFVVTLSSIWFFMGR